jgi:hypothetical protein
VIGKTRNARRAYNAAEEEAYAVLQRLDGRESRSRTARARNLSELGRLESELAALLPIAWPRNSDSAELAAGTRWSAIVIQMVAGTEAADGPYARSKGPDDWERAFGHVLDELTGVTDLGRRAELMTRLYLAAHPVIGGIAAETIARLGTSYTRIALAQQERDASGSMQIIVPQFEKR